MFIPNTPWSPETIRQTLERTKIAAPAVILVVFLVAFITHGVLNAPPGDDVEVQPNSGPGGRPLPKRRQSSQQIKEAAKVRDFSPNVKLLFNWLGLSALLTFVASAILIIFQAILHHQQRWWPGQAAVVSLVLWHLLYLTNDGCRSMLPPPSLSGVSS